MSTTRIPPAATLILFSLLLLVLSVSAESQWQRFNGRYRSRFNATRYGGRHIGSGPGIRVAREFLNAHNKIRASKGQPPLKWDARLARFARHWGTTRMVDCEMLHSNGPYGENIFWGGRDHWTPTAVVQSWADEEEDYDPQANTCSDGKMCGHYTQIVWKSTTRVGCARQKCTGGGVFVICNYYPPGNYVDEHPFRSSPSAEVDRSNPLIPIS